MASDEVGVLRIADDEVADLLGPQSHTVERVGCPDTALLELLAEDFCRDRPASDPDSGDEQYEQGQECHRRDRGDTPPASATHHYGTVRVLAFVTLPRSHRRLVTLPIQARSVGGTNGPLQAADDVA